MEDDSKGGVAQGMPEIHVDSLTGETVVVIGSRQKRPNLPKGDCPFCPGGLEAPQPYDVFSFVNRFPPLGPGNAEVVLYTPQHIGSLWTLPVEQVEKVVELWEQRTEALGSRDDVAYVLIFENHGPEVGATIAHPHGQIYAFDFIPRIPEQELAQGACSLCDEPRSELTVATRGDWSAWCPKASAWPYELLLAPRSHKGDLREASDTRNDLARLLREVLAKLDHLFDAPMPYMMWFHQKPTDGGEWTSAHVHLHIAPAYRAPDTHRFVAAGEIGSGVYFNPVVPTQAAEALRNAEGAVE